MSLTASPPTRSGDDLGDYLFRERRRQGLSQQAVALQLGCYTDQVRFCESGKPVWKVLQGYIDLLAENAPTLWLRQMRRSQERHLAERLGELSPAGCVTLLTLMLHAGRDSSVGRAVALPTPGEQLTLFRPRVLPIPSQ